MQKSSGPNLRYGFGLGGWIPRGVDLNPQELPFPSLLTGDEYFMAQALLAAMEGLGRSNPNPCVGAVIVKEGKVLAKGATLAYGDLHAERVALQQLDPADAAGATVYVTLEPCAGQGKQPPCTEALLAAGIARCVVGALDPHPKANGYGLAQLRQAGIEVTTACLEAECQAWHFPFLRSIAWQRPVLIGKWAQTLDGHLADDKGTSQWISGPESRRYTHWLRQKYDALMVGIGTVLADKPSLTVRDAPPPQHRHPHKIVFDPEGRLRSASEAVIDALGRDLSDTGAHLFWMVDAHVGLELGRGALAKIPHHTVLLMHPGDWEENLLSLQSTYQSVFSYPLQSVLVEGGAHVLTQLLRADLLDALHVFIRAKILGGTLHRVGRLNASGTEEVNPLRGLNEAHDFHLLASHKLGDDVVLECVRNFF